MLAKSSVIIDFEVKTDELGAGFVPMANLFKLRLVLLKKILI